MNDLIARLQSAAEELNYAPGSGSIQDKMAWAKFNSAIAELREQKPVLWWDGKSERCRLPRWKEWDARTGGTQALGFDVPLYAAPQPATEQKPVAWIVNGGTDLVMYHEQDNASAAKYGWVPLYAAPVAPVEQQKVMDSSGAGHLKDGSGGVQAVGERGLAQPGRADPGRGKVVGSNPTPAQVHQSAAPTNAPVEQMVPLSEYRKLQALVTSQGIRLMEAEDATANAPVEPLRVGEVRHATCTAMTSNETLAAGIVQSNPVSDDARDAARYRWLRMNPPWEWPFVEIDEDGCIALCPLNERLDAAIDAAMRGKP